MTSKHVSPTSTNAREADVNAEQAKGLELHGRYKSFFAPEHHTHVAKWFYEKASADQRRDFKRFVREILEFDFEGAKQKLQTTKESNIPEGSAIVRNNNGHLLLPEVRERAVLYISFASKSDKQKYRQSFGHICGFKSFYGSTQMKMDFAPEQKFMKSEKGHLVDRSSEMIGAKKLKVASDPVTAPCEIIGSGKTAYSTMFAWKVAPPAGVNIQQRAHDSTFKGAPWGLYGDDCNKEQWIPHSVAAHGDIKYQFDEKSFRDKLKDPNGSTRAAAEAKASSDRRNKPGQFKSTPPNGATSGVPAKRFIGQQRYQNYNENFCEVLLKLEKDQERDERREQRKMGTTGGSSLPPVSGAQSP